MLPDLIPSDPDDQTKRADWIQIETRVVAGVEKFTAKVGGLDWREHALFNPRTVLGIYPSRQDAIAAAKAVIAMRGVPRLCTWRDVEAVRKENRLRSEMEVA